MVEEGMGGGLDIQKENSDMKRAVKQIYIT